MSHLLEARAVTKKFGGLTALQEVSFHLDQDEILGLIGPNGAGKTTLFNIVAGIYRPDFGEIWFNGEKLSRSRPDEICKKGIARTFQIPKPFLKLTVLENVTVGAYFGSHGRTSLPHAQQSAREVIERVGLKAKIGTLASQLTLVERKRLELARALATQPRILLIDEVVGGLNPTETLEMIEAILEIRASGVALLMIEHVIKAIMRASDRILVLNYGKKLIEGLPKVIVNNPEVIQAYLGRMSYA
jgi:branched-chain amino acid transport system ATP-binding protein